MKSNFRNSGSVATVEYQPKGLDYFLYAPKLRSQVRGSAMSLAQSINHDTLGVQQQDFPYIKSLVNSSMQEKGRYVDMILDGDEFTMQDVKGLGKAFNNSKTVNKSIRESQLNSQRIESKKQEMFAVGVKTGDMGYYKAWLDKSVQDWGGTFKDGRVNQFNMAEVPDYIDIRKNFRKDITMAMRDFTPAQRRAVREGKIEIVPQQTPEGVQMVIKNTIPGINENNFTAVREVLTEYQNRFNDSNSREAQFLEFRTKKDDKYLPALIEDLQDITKFSEMTNEKQGEVRYSAGRFVANPTPVTPLVQLGSVTDDISARNPMNSGWAKYTPPSKAPKRRGSYVQEYYKGDEKTNISKRNPEGITRGVTKTRNVFKENVSYSPNVDDETYINDNKRFYKAFLGTEDPTVAYIQDELTKVAVGSPESNSALQVLKDKYPQKFNNLVEDVAKLKELNADDITISNKDRDESKILGSASTKRLALKEKLNGKLDDIYHKYNKGLKSNFSTQQIVYKNEAALKMDKSAMAASIEGSDVIQLEYDAESNELIPVQSGYINKNGNPNEGGAALRNILRGVLSASQGKAVDGWSLVGTPDLLNKSVNMVNFSDKGLLEHKNPAAIRRNFTNAKVLHLKYNKVSTDPPKYYKFVVENKGPIRQNYNTLNTGVSVGTQDGTYQASVEWGLQELNTSGDSVVFKPLYSEGSSEGITVNMLDNNRYIVTGLENLNYDTDVWEANSKAQLDEFFEEHLSKHLALSTEEVEESFNN